jgi:hypothetical protein
VILYVPYRFVVLFFLAPCHVHNITRDSEQIQNQVLYWVQDTELRKTKQQTDKAHTESRVILGT